MTQRDERRNQRAEDERQRAVIVVDRVPVAADQKVPAEFVQGRLRTVGQFVADEHDEHKDGQRHEQRQPFEGAVAKVAAGRLRALPFVVVAVCVHHFFRSLAKIKRTKSGRNCALRPAHAHKNTGRRNEVSI